MRAITSMQLDRGACVDVRSDQGATPLMNAVQAASMESTKLLLDRGADANARDGRGFTALHRAAEMGLADIVRLLLDRGATVEVDAEGRTPRSLAEGRDRNDVLAMLQSPGLPLVAAGRHGTRSDGLLLPIVEQIHCDPSLSALMLPTSCRAARTQRQGHRRCRTSA